VVVPKKKLGGALGAGGEGGSEWQGTFTKPELLELNPGILFQSKKKKNALHYERLEVKRLKRTGGTFLTLSM
jgi:hypothetical protein